MWSRSTSRKLISFASKRSHNTGYPVFFCMKKTWIISACLLGTPCRYDGKSCPFEIPDEWKDIELVPVCPEVLGGLPVPRTPSEIREGKVYFKSGEDVTEFFRKGALKTLEIARKNHADAAVLKSKSPSCGYGRIYDGTFTGNLTEGKGITAKRLEENGIRIISSEEFEKTK